MGEDLFALLERAAVFPPALADEGSFAGSFFFVKGFAFTNRPDFVLGIALARFRAAAFTLVLGFDFAFDTSYSTGSRAEDVACFFFMSFQ
jgi:hypothetical protein